jgi:hypothetical protein
MLGGGCCAGSIFRIIAKSAAQVGDAFGPGRVGIAQQEGTVVLYARRSRTSTITRTLSGGAFWVEGPVTTGDGEMESA